MSISSATTKSASPSADGQIARLSNGIELCWEERGDGPPIVLVMGIGAQLVHWPDGFCDLLADSGFRVIRFDNRDVGLSSRLDHLRTPPIGRTLVAALTGARVTAPYTLVDMADDVAGLLDHLQLPSAHIVGASMGGMIAQTMAFTHPERVRTLTSIMSHTGRPGLGITEPRALRALLSPVPRTREEAGERGVEFMRTVGSTKFPQDEADIWERSARAFDRGLNPRGFLRHLAAIAASGDRTSRLRFVRAPTLVVHGTVDPLLRPIGGRSTADAIPGAQLEMIEGMGHDLPQGVWQTIANSIAAMAHRAVP